MKRFLVFFVLAGLLFSPGCKSPMSAELINLSGDWNGTFQIPKFNESGSISFTLSQSGNQLTGTFTTTTGRYGKMSGSISGQTVTGTLTFQDWCRGSSSLTSTVSSDGRKITGNANTNDCLGNYSISFSVTKK